MTVFIPIFTFLSENTPDFVLLKKFLQNPSTLFFLYSNTVDSNEKRFYLQRDLSLTDYIQKFPEFIEKKNNLILFEKRLANRWQEYLMSQENDDVENYTILYLGKLKIVRIYRGFVEATILDIDKENDYFSILNSLEVFLGICEFYQQLKPYKDSEEVSTDLTKNLPSNNSYLDLLLAYLPDYIYYDSFSQSLWLKDVIVEIIAIITRKPEIRTILSQIENSKQKKHFKETKYEDYLTDRIMIAS